MASPHVAGAVALLWSAAPWLIGEIDLTEQILLKSAAVVEDSRCSGASEAISPNPAFGYGRLDVAAAVEMAQPWQTTVTVSDTVGAPVAGATVTWIDARTAYTYSATTNIQGSALITPMLAGLYSVTVQGATGVVETSTVELANTGDVGEPQTRHVDLLYTPLQPALDWLYLPSVIVQE